MNNRVGREFAKRSRTVFMNFNMSGVFLSRVPHLDEGQGWIASAGPTYYDYDAYGKNLGADYGATSGHKPLATHMYTGEQYDTDLQQTYLRARYYNADNSRFNRLDPFEGVREEPQSLHKYAYVHGDPVNSIDPSGLISLVSLAVGVGIGAGIVGFTASYALGGNFKDSLITGLYAGIGFGGAIALGPQNWWKPLVAGVISGMSKVVASYFRDLIVNGDFTLHDWRDDLRVFLEGFAEGAFWSTVSQFLLKASPFDFDGDLGIAIGVIFGDILKLVTKLTAKYIAGEIGLLKFAGAAAIGLLKALLKGGMIYLVIDKFGFDVRTSEKIAVAVVSGLFGGVLSGELEGFIEAVEAF